MARKKVVIEFLGKDRLTRVARKIKDAMGKVDKSFKKSDDRLKRFSVRLKKVGTQLRKLAGIAKKAGIAGLLAGSVVTKIGFSEAKQFEKGILRALTNAETRAQRRALRPAVVKITNELLRRGLPGAEVREGVFQQLSFKGATPEALEGLGAAVKLSIGAFTTFDSAVVVLNKAAEIWRDEIPDRIANKLLAAQQKGALDVQALADVLPTIGSEITRGKFTATNTLALLAEASKILGPQKAAIGLRGLVTQVSQIVPGTPRFDLATNPRVAFPAGILALQKVGIPGLLEAIERLNATRAGTAILSQIITSTEAAALSGIVTQAFLTGFRETARSTDVTKGLDLAAFARKNSLEFQMNRVQAQFAETARIIGTTFMPAFKEFSDFIQIAALRNRANDGGAGGFFKELAIAQVEATGANISGRSEASFRASRTAEISSLQDRFQRRSEFFGDTEDLDLTGVFERQRLVVDVNVTSAAGLSTGVRIAPSSGINLGLQTVGE